MRVRILKGLKGVIDGHALSHFVPGQIYDIDHFTGAQLIELGAAIEVRSTDPTVEDVERLTGGVVVIPPDQAEDRSEYRRRKPRGK